MVLKGHGFSRAGKNSVKLWGFSPCGNLPLVNTRDELSHDAEREDDEWQTIRTVML